jgi:ATP-dependent Lhr-like helicase
MLVSPNVPHRELFAHLRAVVVDECHAFAGDDRGWHLLGVLGRLAGVAGRDLQRVGLSATVGNPDGLARWVGVGSARPPRVVRPPVAANEPAPEITLDYVGGLENAAAVLARLYRGKKRLVYCDSRSRVEQLSARLRAAGLTVFVTHSSLSLDERRQAERAFAAGRDCVIAATSALELGIDVGDLDRVVQVDAPATVSSFLQRMGRTGRRPGTTRNCLFLATTDDALLRAAALVRLWRAGFVEPAAPPPEPLHVFAQQILGLVLQRGGLAWGEWVGWLGPWMASAGIDPARADGLVRDMVDRDILCSDGGVLGVGRAGEELYGRRNYLEVLSVFAAPPEFTVYCGAEELGSVHETSFQGRAGPPVLLLAGRTWRVRHVDWGRRKAFVEPAPDRAGRSVWRGGGAWLSWEVCQAVAEVLAAGSSDPAWSRRAAARMGQVRADHPWADPAGCPVVVGPKGKPEWWTFAGYRANATLVGHLRAREIPAAGWDNFTVTLPAGPAVGHLLTVTGPADPAPPFPATEAGTASAKFAECLSPDSLATLQRARLSDWSHAATVLRRPRSTFG